MDRKTKRCIEREKERLKERWTYRQVVLVSIL